MSAVPRKRRGSRFDTPDRLQSLDFLFSLFDGPVVIADWTDETTLVEVVERDVEGKAEDEGRATAEAAIRAYASAVVRRWLRDRGGPSR